MTLQETLTNEIKSAVAAREAGNEGKARVCARRAVGWAIKEYLREQNETLVTSSAYEFIKYLRNQPDTRADMRQVLDHFLQRVEKDSPDEDSYWPLEVDLIDEAKWVITKLLGFEIPA